MSKKTNNIEIAGGYQICWNNEMARWTAKVVQFDILVGDRGQRQKVGAADYTSSKFSHITSDILNTF